MGVTARGLVIGSALLVVLSVITLDRYRDAMQRRPPGRLRTEGLPAEEAPPDPARQPLLDPDGETEFVVRLGGVRIPPPGEVADAGGLPSTPGSGGPPAAASGDFAPRTPASRPDASAGISPSGGSGAEPSTREIEHTVDEGETLGEIATRYFGRYDMWKSIARWNGITDPRKVRAGQKLTIRLE